MSSRCCVMLPCDVMRCDVTARTSQDLEKWNMEQGKNGRTSHFTETETSSSHRSGSWGDTWKWAVREKCVCVCYHSSSQSMASLVELWLMLWSYTVYVLIISCRFFDAITICSAQHVIYICNYTPYWKHHHHHSCVPLLGTVPQRET